jgi:hypothetical protein
VIKNQTILFSILCKNQLISMVSSPVMQLGNKIRYSKEEYLEELW